jgi:hypothetical protein
MIPRSGRPRHVRKNAPVIRAWTSAKRGRMSGEVTKPGDRVKLPKSVAALYRIVEELEKAYPGRPFTPDAHLVGSIGEVVKVIE